MSATPKDLLADVQLEEALAGLPGWELKGKQLVKQFDFKSFADAIEAVNEAARLAEAANHHPDIHINFRKVKFLLWTHKFGGITTLDVRLAGQIDRAVQGG